MPSHLPRLAGIALVITVACGTPPADPPDAQPDPIDASTPPPDTYVAPQDAPWICDDDRSCDDGVFCNGAERCRPGDPTADRGGCAPAIGTACTEGRTCREAARACLTECDLDDDADDDGHAAMECGGDDCDDGDAERSPSAPEVCDDGHRDEDCDPTTLGGTDADGDGHLPATCCNGSGCGTDCDDARAAVHPGARETCDGTDEDCDGEPDDLATSALYADADGDGFGAGTPTQACPTAGFVLRAGDCDDTDAARSPLAREACNGDDDDCDGVTDEGGGPEASCPLGTHCEAGACAPDPAGCGPGLFECDGDPMTACDTDVSTSVTSCGACGRACAPSHSCLDAVCRLRTTAVALELGDQHACAITPARTLVCWGNNTDGQLGDATDVRRIRPTPIAAPTGVDQLALGSTFSCARAAGEIWCWGSDSYGQLGDGAVGGERHTPLRVPGIAGAIDVSTGMGHGCAVLADHTVRCWGLGDSGQLGHGMTDRSPTPVTVVGLADATQVAAGAQHTCALRATGAVVCWGENLNYQLGDGVGSTMRTSTPVPVVGITDAVQLAAGGDHTCVVHAGGAASCWGGDGWGELGRNGTSPSGTPVPTAVVGVDDAVRIAAGEHHTCVLRAAGRLSCFGRDDDGQLGNGDPPGSWFGGRPAHPVPVDVFAAGATEIALGDHHTCAIRNGAVWCWGSSYSGQIGDGAFLARFSPVALAELTP